MTVALPGRRELKTDIFRLEPWHTNAVDKKLFILFFSSFYGLFLATRPLLDFVDRENYLNYFIVSDYLIEKNLNEGIVFFISNEPLWLLLADRMGASFGPETSLRLLIGIPAAVVAFVAFRFAPNHLLWVIVFLFVPLIMKNHVIHLRQGLAVAIFVFGYLIVRGRLSRWIIILACPLVHSSFFFVVGLLLISKIFSFSKLKMSHSLFLVIASCCLIAFFLPLILGISGARQVASLDFAGASVSGFGLVFWASILFLILHAGAEQSRNLAFPITILVFYLATYFTFEYAGRVLESATMIVLLGLLRLPRSERHFALLAISLYFLLTWLPRFGSPGLGWGI